MTQQNKRTIGGTRNAHIKLTNLSVIENPNDAMTDNSIMDRTFTASIKPGLRELYLQNKMKPNKLNTQRFEQAKNIDLNESLNKNVNVVFDQKGVDNKMSLFQDLQRPTVF